MPDLVELCRRAVEVGGANGAVEAFGTEGTRTEVRVRDGAVESLTFASSRGVGVRVIAQERVGCAFAADPDLDEVEGLVRAAEDGARFAEPEPSNVLPALVAPEPIPGLTRPEVTTLPTERKVALALDLERAAVSASP